MQSPDELLLCVPFSRLLGFEHVCCLGFGVVPCGHTPVQTDTNLSALSAIGTWQSGRRRRNDDVMGWVLRCRRCATVDSSRGSQVMCFMGVLWGALVWKCQRTPLLWQQQHGRLRRTCCCCRRRRPPPHHRTHSPAQSPPSALALSLIHIWTLPTIYSV